MDTVEVIAFRRDRNHMDNELWSNIGHGQLNIKKTCLEFDDITLPYDEIINAISNIYPGNSGYSSLVIETKFTDFMFNYRLPKNENLDLPFPAHRVRTSPLDIKKSTVLKFGIIALLITIAKAIWG